MGIVNYVIYVFFSDVGLILCYFQHVLPFYSITSGSGSVFEWVRFSSPIPFRPNLSLIRVALCFVQIDYKDVVEKLM